MRFAVFLIILLSFNLALASSPDTVTLPDSSEADYTYLKKIVSRYVYTLTQPVYVYNWYQAPDDSSLTTNSQDPKAYSSVQKVANRYWDKQTDSQAGQGDMFGTGLYAAIDPVSSRSFGGEHRWVLTQIHLPAGFKILNLNRDGGYAFPMNKSYILTHLGCPDSWKYQPLFSNLMNPKAYMNYPKCAAAIRKLFKNDLKIDGFAYDYSATHFKECDSSDPDSQVAFVITNGDKLKKDDIRVFDRLTTDDQKDRIRIQSLFIKSVMDANNGGPSIAQLVNFLNTHNGSRYTSWLQNQMSSGSTTSGTGFYSTYCDSSPQTPSDPRAMASVTRMQCINLVMPVGLLGSPSASAEPTTLNPSSSPSEFLWKDLEGKPFDKDVGTWIQKNLYACNKEPAYAQVDESKIVAPVSTVQSGRQAQMTNPSGTDVTASLR